MYLKCIMYFRHGMNLTYTNTDLIGQYEQTDKGLLSVVNISEDLLSNS